MATQDIQEMLEGMLNDEQTAEVLHRLSVSPEKLSAFRQHMALRGAFEQDARIDDLNDEEDDAVWAAVLGATGGLVTGGTAVGASSWLARGVAFLLTGLAGFFIGAGMDGTLLNSDDNAALSPTGKEQVAENLAAKGDPGTPALQSAPASVRVDTVVQRVVEYRDRIQYKYIERPAPAADLAEARSRTPEDRQKQSSLLGEAEAVDNGSTSNDLSSNNRAFSAEGNTSTTSTETTPNLSAPAESSPSNQDGANQNLALSSSSPPENTPSVQQDSETSSPSTSSIVLDPNTDILNNRSPSSETTEPPSPEKESTTLSLMQDGFEIGYSERLGRITALPFVQNEGGGNYGGHALELTARMLEGKVGLGTRLIYGSFSTVTLSEDVQNIGFADTVLVPSLESSPEFNVEVFANCRIPLFTKRMAVGVEWTFGLSSSRFKMSGDLLGTYLLTEQIGLQGGIGYGAYRYTTQQVRTSRLDAYENAAVSDKFVDLYEGTMLEGHYGLFFRF